MQEELSEMRCSTSESEDNSFKEEVGVKSCHLSGVLIKCL
jgi:hypothetical protein